MAIPAKRFNFLDNETNVAVSNFQNLSTNSILNSPNNALNLVSADLSNFVSSAIQSTEAILPNIEDIRLPSVLDSDSIRKVKGLFPDIQDISGLSVKDLGDLIGDMIPDDPRLQGAFSRLDKRCSTRSLGTGAIGRPYNPSLNCNGRNRRGKSGLCNSQAANNIFNTLSGGSYNASFQDLNKLLKKIIGLATYGYDMNLCGVFNVLSSGIEKYVKSRASGALVNMLAGSENTFGIMDLASSSIGLDVKLENPLAVNQTFSTVKLPSDLIERDYSGFADSLLGAVDIFDTDWKTSDTSNALSTKEISSYNKDLDSLFSGKLMDNIFIEDDLSVAPNDDFTFMASALKTNDFKRYDLLMA